MKLVASSNSDFVGVEITDPVSQAGFNVTEGSGNDDVLLNALTSNKPSLTSQYFVTTTRAHVTTTVSSVIKTATEPVATQAGLPSFVSERLYVFIAVLVLLVMVAVGIALYVRLVHAKRQQHTFSPTVAR